MARMIQLAGDPAAIATYRSRQIGRRPRL